MKRRMILFILFSFLLFMVGCREEDFGDISVGLIDDYIESSVETIVTDQEKIDLPTYHPEYDCEITWESFDERYIASNGAIIKKPNKITEVSLLYTLTYNDYVKEEEIVITIYPSSIDKVAMQFENQFTIPIERSYTRIKTNYYDCYSISWFSTNQDVFSNKGEYNKPNVDTDFEIVYTVSFLGQEKEFTIECHSSSMTAMEKVEKTYEWLRDEGGILHETLLTDDLQFETYISKYGVFMDLESSNIDVIDNYGKIKKSVYRRYARLKIKLSHSSVTKVYELDVEVKEIDSTNLSEEEKIKIFLQSIARSNYGGVQYGYYDNIKTPNGNKWIINKSFGFLSFYENKYPKQIESLMKANKHNLPGTKLKSVEFIVMHDTGSTGTAENHKNALLNTNIKTSFHYCVDNREIYHLVNDNLYALHAGCGQREFKLIDTKIKATNTYPTLEINEKGYYTLNGKNSNIKAPTNNGRLLSTKDIVDLGIYTTVGKNGNYHINDSYYNTTYKKISNTGGGINGIGIEMCVVPNEDYIITVRNTAKLVAKLLVKNNLNLDRVVQHNHFSGKDCPIAIRRASWWNEFKELISLEKYALENFKDYDFVWESKNNSLNNNGLINSEVKENEKLTYTCKVKKGNEIIFEDNFYTKVTK